MTDLSQFDPNAPGNPNNNIFGLPFSEEEARLIILPVPWEVTVSCNAGTARAASHILKSSLQIDLFDPDVKDGWREGFYMRNPDKKVLMRSDYLRKEAELYIDYISKGEQVENNPFMCKSLKEINEGSRFLNNWVYEQTRELLHRNKLVALLGGDHSVCLGYLKALAEKHGDFGMIQLDAHCDLRKSYENFIYSHASIMYNALEEIPQIKRLVQLGARNLSEQEWEYICESGHRVVTYFDKEIKERKYEGQNWQSITDEIIEHLPQQVYLSFDIDGLDRKYAPNTSTPVPGGLELDEIAYLLRRLIKSGRKLIGFDLTEIGTGESGWDVSVGANVLWRLCNIFILSSRTN